jgi:High potential iron-sulfur protein
MTSRRTFIAILPLTGGLLAAGLARAQAAAVVSDKDAQAVALGYVSDAAKADKAKFKQYAAGQHCGSCALFQGAAGAADGACPIFGGKHVAAKGWCSAYVKKA